jgi:hypothetical protein
MFQHIFNKIGWLILVFVGVMVNHSFAVNATGSLIPFYIYPTPTAIQPLLDAKSAHPSVPICVILNPNSGVGTFQNPDYVQAITTLRQAGIQVVGYVYTNYNSRPIQEVKTEISQWKAWYQPDGIFLDAMGADPNYYLDLSQFIKSEGMTLSIGNANQNVDTSYLNLVDIVVIANQAGFPDLSHYCTWQIDPNTNKAKSAFLIYNVATLPLTLIQQAKEFIGWIYLTPDDLPNPWDSLPTYFANLIAALDSSSSHATGIIVPFYLYPSNTAIQPLLTGKSQNPHVPMRVILNPNSGPGTTIDPTYVNAAQKLKQAGITVLGYVHTSYGKRPIADIEREINQWFSWYQPDGIFLDEMALNHSYYSAITAYAKNKGAKVVVGNPGTNIDPSAAADVDSLIIFEKSSLPSLNQFSNWQNAKVPPTQLGFLSYHIAQLPGKTYLQQISPLFGWIYITQDNLPNPWDSLPSYFPTLLKDLEVLNQETE